MFICLFIVVQNRKRPRDTENKFMVNKGESGEGVN